MVITYDKTKIIILNRCLEPIIELADDTSAFLDVQRYMPFGQVRTDKDSIDQTDFGYTFQRNLPELGLMDYRARMYDARIGRFVQADSIVPGAGIPEAWNKYAYSNNNPIMMNDPSGHGSCRNFNDGQGCITNWRTEDPPGGGFEQIIKNDAVREQQSSQVISSTPTITTSSNTVMIVCGDSVPCNSTATIADYSEPNSTNTEVPLDEYITWANESGYLLEFFPQESLTNKYGRAQSIAEYIAAHPDQSFFIIGHSSGANASILAVDLAGYSQQIKGVVLLDPTLTAKLPDGSDDISGIADQIVQNGIPVFVGDTNKDFYSGVPFITPIKGSTYKNYPDSYTHKGLAVSQEVFNDFLEALDTWSQ